MYPKLANKKRSRVGQEVMLKVVAPAIPTYIINHSPKCLQTDVKPCLKFLVKPRRWRHKNSLGEMSNSM